MASTKTSISYHGTIGLEEAKGMLRDLLASLEEGKVVIRRGSEHISLVPAAHVELELTGKQKKDRQSLAIELSWQMASPLKASADVVISSEEPEPAPDEAQTTGGHEGGDTSDGGDDDSPIAP